MKRIEFFRHNIDRKDRERVNNVLRSIFLTTGKEVEEFELKFSQYTGLKYTVGLTSILTSAVINAGCIVPVYCFMPDHQHLIITGVQSVSDIRKAIISYKQKTGFWMSEEKVGARWQKDFYDHVLRRHEDIAVQVRYILDNPVRKGLVASWQGYPYKGSIGCRMDDVLCGMV